MEHLLKIVIKQNSKKLKFYNAYSYNNGIKNEFDNKIAKKI